MTKTHPCVQCSGIHLPTGSARVTVEPTSRCLCVSARKQRCGYMSSILYESRQLGQGLSSDSDEHDTFQA